MKKYIILILLIFFSCYAFAKTSDKFVEALRNCTPFSDSGMVNINGIDTKSDKHLLGWQNNKCVYKETLDFNGTKISTVCRFSKPQIKEIVSVADAYYVTLKYSNQQPDLSSLDALQNNPVAQVLGKYLQDASVCSMSGF